MFFFKHAPTRVAPIPLQELPQISLLEMPQIPLQEMPQIPLQEFYKKNCFILFTPNSPTKHAPACPEWV